MENLDLTKLLAGHEGEKFYTTVYGDVILDEIRKTQKYEDVLIVRGVSWNAGREVIKSNGKICSAGEVVMFPSQDQRDWNKWEKENTISYSTIAPSLFNNGGWIQDDNCMTKFTFVEEPNTANPFLGFSKNQLIKLGMINKLMNIQKSIENGWQPDWTNETEDKYVICLDGDEIKVCLFLIHMDCVYFSSEANAQKAIKILGEVNIKLALTTNF